jgi:hypothetical protein
LLTLEWRLKQRTALPEERRPAQRIAPSPQGPRAYTWTPSRVALQIGFSQFAFTLRTLPDAKRQAYGHRRPTRLRGVTPETSPKWSPWTPRNAESEGQGCGRSIATIHKLFEALDRVDTKDKRELRGAILAVALHFLLYPSSATANDITPLRAFLVCTCVVRHRYHTDLSISGRGNDISPCAAGLLNAATMLSAFYVMEPSEQSVRDARLAEVLTMRQPAQSPAALVAPAAVLAAVLAAARRAAPSEYIGAQFRVCHNAAHGQCGTVRSTELSVQQSVAQRGSWSTRSGNISRTSFPRTKV